MGLVINGCTEYTLVDSQPGPPFIEYVDIQPREVKEFSDSILITFKYSDPDGDLGTESPDQKTLSIHDLRLQNADKQHVSLLAPIDSKIDISGILTVKLKNTFLLGSNDEEKTTYELILTDRAGNASNPIVTDEITIKR
ncbi:MAG: hypothetical protein H6607_06440 [Flavobacteriales bacterium]|nr:hypothetical protein [Flavobacteriales bacterium]